MCVRACVCVGRGCAGMCTHMHYALCMRLGSVNDGGRGEKWRVYKSIQVLAIRVREHKNIQVLQAYCAYT